MRVTKENIHDIDFDKGEGLVPSIVQHAVTGEVLMLGYMNAGSLIKTLESNKVTFWSRSKNGYWTKGETSGNFLHLESITMDCDKDSLLVLAHPEGSTCHTGAYTCFSNGEVPSFKFQDAQFLLELSSVVKDRKHNPKEGSYTNALFDKGINKIAQKVGEEAIELVIEAKDDDKKLFLGEMADLWYHLMVLLAEKGYDLNELAAVLKERHK